MEGWKHVPQDPIPFVTLQFVLSFVITDIKYPGEGERTYLSNPSYFESTIFHSLKWVLDTNEYYNT